MQTFSIKGENRISSVYVGEHLANVESYLPDKPLVIITDENIAALYRDFFPKAPVIIMGTGEKNKTLATVASVLEQLMEIGCDRSWFILGIGGGIVCDLAGFAASIFLRGVPFGFVSTSLLSQVDASVGGKNGVNLSSYNGHGPIWSIHDQTQPTTKNESNLVTYRHFHIKRPRAVWVCYPPDWPTTKNESNLVNYRDCYIKNMAGVFSQPEFVICDISMLTTLPKSELSNGMAEIIKHGLIADENLFSFLEENAQKALNLDHEVLFRLVADSVAIKSTIVQQDEKEAGERRKLNFGHTLGHAAETLDPSGHGRAVAMGIHAACVFSSQLGLIDSQVVQRVDHLLIQCQLPTIIPHPADKITEAVKKDKKKQGNFVHFVLLKAIGKACIRKISYDDLSLFIQKLCFNPIE